MASHPGVPLRTPAVSRLVSDSPAGEPGRRLSSRTLTTGAHARIPHGFVFVPRRVFLQLPQDFLHAESAAAAEGGSGPGQVGAWLFKGAEAVTASRSPPAANEDDDDSFPACSQ